MHISSLMRWTSTFLQIICGIAIFTVALRFLRADEFLPWHAQALELSWAELPSDSFRVFLLQMIHVVGGGQLLVAALLIVAGLLVWQQSKSILTVLLPALTSCFSIPLYLAVIEVSANTAGDPPLTLTFSLILLIFVSLILNSWLLYQYRKGL